MTKYKDFIYIKTIRELQGIDGQEMMAMINRIGNYADEYDDISYNKYWGGAVDKPGSV